MILLRLLPELVIALLPQTRKPRGYNYPIPPKESNVPVCDRINTEDKGFPGLVEFILQMAFVDWPLFMVIII